MILMMMSAGAVYMAVGNLFAGGVPYFHHFYGEM
jgi:hypothetical protein